MRKASFDVPEAMKNIYDLLTQMGFTPRISIAPSEWDSPQGGWVRFLHVHGEVEVTHRPFGKREHEPQQKWRICPADNTIVTFNAWLSGIADTIRMSLRPSE